MVQTQHQRLVSASDPFHFRQRHNRMPVVNTPMSPAGRLKVAPIKHPGRLRITNGSAFLPGTDNRGPWIRRCKDVIAAHMSDLGGEDNTSAAERSIIRRVGVLTAELEHLEVRFASAGEAECFRSGSVSMHRE